MFCELEWFNCIGIHVLLCSVYMLLNLYEHSAVCQDARALKTKHNFILDQTNIKYQIMVLPTLYFQTIPDLEAAYI